MEPESSALQADSLPIELSGKLHFLEELCNLADVLVSYWWCSKFHKLSAITQPKFIMLWFWRSKIQNEFHWDKNEVSGCLCSFGDSNGEFCSVILPVSKSHLNSLALPSFFKGQQCSIFKSLPLTLTFLLPS